LKKLFIVFITFVVTLASSWCYAYIEKIPIKIINNSTDAVGQELVKALKDQIDQTAFLRLAVTEPCKIEIIVTTKNKNAPKLPPPLTVKQAKHFEGITLSQGNPYIDFDDSFLTNQQLTKLRDSAAMWEAEHSNKEENSISYSIIWLKNEQHKSIYLDTMLGFCESATTNLISENILTKTKIIIDKSNFR
jgi:hypothetical protein